MVLLKIPFFLVCTIIVVNSYPGKSSEEKRSWLDDGSSSFTEQGNDRQQIKMKRNGDDYGANQREQGTQTGFWHERHAESDERYQMEENPRGQRGVSNSGQSDTSTYRRERLISRERPQGLRGQKLEIKYSPSSSSSEENSSESHEIQQVQKQYHNTIPHNSGNGRWVQSQIQPRTRTVPNFVSADFQEERTRNVIDKDNM